MCAKMAFQHQAGTAMECLSVNTSIIYDKKNIKDKEYKKSQFNFCHVFFKTINFMNTLIYYFC